MRTAVYLDLEEFKVLAAGEPFNLYLAKGDKITIQVDPQLMKQPNDLTVSQKQSCECGFSSETVQGLSLHKRRAHAAPALKPTKAADSALVCECGRAFPTARALTTHRVRNHGAPKGEWRKRESRAVWECGKCPSRFATALGLDKHMEELHP
jgi:hypothetical protein